MTIKLSRRKQVHEKNIVLGWPQIRKIVAEQYKCSDSHILGECLNPGQGMDNNYEELCEKTWDFFLIPKKKNSATPSSKKQKKRSTRSKKTMAKK